MKIFNWNNEKNLWLKENRGICFEDILFYIDYGCLVDDTSHPNQKKYPNQRIMAVNINDYIYLVPYIENETERYLKTIIPSRKATKKYLGGNNE
ncbi:MAG: BrnT family toxin [Candidatus Marinimicrobia bacterium]|nr:BrnT family toxin [Candidatus Neomarinimicrobiota bacterium]